MATIKEIKAQYPQYQALSDTDLADRLYERHYAGKIERSTFDKQVGLVPDDYSPTFWESVKAGVEGLGAAGDALDVGWNAMVGDQQDQDLAMVEFNKHKQKAGELLANATDWRDILDAKSVSEGTGKFLDYAKEQIGLNSPQMAAIMAGGVGGAAVAPILPHPVATAVSKVGGFAVGATMAALPVFTGYNVSRQLDEGQEPNLTKAALLAVPQAASEAVFGGILAKTGLTTVGAKVFGEAPGIAGTVAGKVSEAIAVGVPGEVFQQALERTAAKLEVNPFTSEEAANEYLDAAIAAGVQGGGFGAASGMYSTLAGVPKNLPPKVKADLEEVLKEDILKSPAPKSGIITTLEEADAVIRNQGFSPTAFPEDIRVKAANVMLDRVEDNRLGYQAMFSGVARENLIQHTQANLRSFTGLTPVAPLKVKVQTKTPITDTDLGSIKTETEMKSIAEVIAPNSPFVKQDLKPEIYVTPTLPLDASGEVNAAQANAKLRYRLKSKTPPNVPNEPNLSQIPGQIQADLKIQERKHKDLMKLNTQQLAQKAQEVGVPESELKDVKSGLWRKKQDIADAIMRKSYENPEILPEPRMPPVQEGQPNPLNRTSPTPEVDVNNAAQKLQAKGEKRKKAKKMAQDVKQAIKYKEIIIDPKKSLDAASVIDTDVNGNPARPTEVLQEANLFNAALNFDDSSDYLNLEDTFMEVWHYLNDSGVISDVDKAVVEKSLPRFVDNLVEVFGLPKKSLRAMSKTPTGAKEIVATTFAKFMEAKRKGETFNGVPRKVLPVFNKAYKSLQKAKAKMKSQGFYSLEDVFDVTDGSAQDALANGVTNARQARLQNLADEMQEAHWKDLDSNLLDNMMEQATQEQKDLGKLGLYGKFLSSFTHLAHKNPLAGVIMGIKRNQEDMQAALLTKYREAGEAYFAEPTKEVRTKAAEVLDHLRNTGQKLTKDSNGALTFVRDNQVVQIQNPRMIATIEALDRATKQVLNDAEMSIRGALEEILPGATLMTPEKLQKEANKMFDDSQMSAKDRDFIQDQVQTLEDIDRMRSKSFMPHVRHGTWGFTVHRKDNITASGKVKPDAVPVYHSQVEEGKHMGKYDRYQYNEVQKALEQYRNDPEYKVFEGFEMTYANIYDKLGETQLTFDLLSSLLGSAKDEKAYVQIKEQLDRDVRFKGFARRFTPSENIPGYSNDWDRVVSSYFTSSAHYFAKQKHGPMLQRANNQIQNGPLGDFHRDIKKKIQNYVDYTSSPFDSFQEIRALNFMWTMGGNLSSAALQIMTLPTTTLGSMTQYNPNVIDNMKNISRFFKIGMGSMAQKDVWQVENGVLIFKTDSEKFVKNLKEKHKMSDDEVNFVKTFFKSGRSGAAFLEEQTGTYRYDTRTKGGQLRTKIDEISNVLGVPISAMEQATRFATALAHYKMFKDNPQAVKRATEILSGDYRFQALRKLSQRPLIEDLTLFGLDEAHAVFGKVGRGDLLRGGFGAFLFPFMTYPQQAVEFLSRMVGRGPEGRKALLTTLGSLFLFAGLTGLPGADLFKELLEEAYKMATGEEVDFEMLLQERLQDATGGPSAGLFLTNGIFRSLFNIDVSNRIGLPLFGQDLLLAAMGVQGDMTELAGVQGSMVTQAIEAWRAYNSDESGVKVASMVTPMALSNLLKAYTYYDEGAVTGKGKQLVTPEEFRENPQDIVLRAAGIGSGRVADARDKRYWSTLANGRYKGKMETLRNRAKNFRTREERARIRGDQEEALKWSRKYEDVLQDVVDFVTKKDIPYDINSFVTSVEEAVVQRIEGGVQYKELNKSAKEDYEFLKSGE